MVGFSDLLGHMKAMNQGDFSHLVADMASSSHPEALQKLPEIVIAPTPLDEFMAALDKCGPS